MHAVTHGGDGADVLAVLVVDDDDALRALVAGRLGERGMAVTEAASGEHALEHLRRAPPDVVVLDVHLPGSSGLDVLREVRAEGCDVQVILLTGAGQTAERVVGLELGADDYMVKPFSLRELEARVRAVARRRRGHSAAATIVVGDLAIDCEARAVSRHGVAIELTPKELALLMYLASNPGRAFTRDELLRRVWASSASWQQAATVTEHVRRLRLKLEDDPAAPRLIATVRGSGYRFDRRPSDPQERPE